MSWRRYDDGYEDHPKILELLGIAGPWAYYRLNKIHGYCARLHTSGHVPRAALRELGVTRKMLAAMLAVGLLDEDETGELTVHDWADYNQPDSTNAERQRRFRARRNADSNANTAVTRNAESNAVAVTRNADVTRARALAAARDAGAGAARVPVPEDQELTKAVTSTRPSARDEPTNGPGFQTDEQTENARKRIAALQANIADNLEQP